ncbi:hypothetical protein PV325_004826, partial [Microctonus aethiopoides]
MTSCHNKIQKILRWDIDYKIIVFGILLASSRQDDKDLGMADDLSSWFAVCRETFLSLCGEKSINDHHTIVVPRKVTYNGTLMSHNVTHYHDNDGALLHYRLEMSGMEYHLQLIPSNDFIGPGMVVERRKRDIHVRYTARERSSKCHYRGFIRGHVNSLVALSACDGL